MTIPKHIQFSLAGCHSENFGIAWEHFGAVWTWAIGQEWWEGFVKMLFFGKLVDVCEEQEGLWNIIPTRIVDPSSFANAINAYLSE